MTPPVKKAVKQAAPPVEADTAQEEPQEPPYRPSGKPGGRPLTELGNSERLIDDHGATLRYVPALSCWLVWDGHRWKADERSYLTHLAKQTIRTIGRHPGTLEFGNAAAHKWARACEKAGALANMVRLAQSDPAVVVDAGALDAAEHLLAVTNGVVDLRTKDFRPGRPEDLLTKQAGTFYDPAATAPKWAAFLAQVMLGDQEMVAFLQLLAGYAATGSTAEHLMVVNLGGGRNGKGIFQEVLAAVLGEYAQTMPAASLMESRYGETASGPSSDVARMRGARYVQCSETAAGCRLAESKVKSLTSSDTQVARFLNREFFQFKPSATIFLATNHRPDIKGDDKAIWSRLRLVGWDLQVSEEAMNKHLYAELLEELPGILAWVVEGAHRWYTGGMTTPAKVRQAVADYRAEMDTLGDFLDQECITDPELGSTAMLVEASVLYDRYRSWALAQGEKNPLNQRMLGPELTKRGFTRRKYGRSRRWHWVGLTVTDTWVGIPDPFEVTAPLPAQTAAP